MEKIKLTLTVFLDKNAVVRVYASNCPNDIIKMAKDYVVKQGLESLNDKEESK